MRPVTCADAPAMAMRRGRPERSRAAGLVHAFLFVTAGMVAAVSLYVGLIQAGVIRNPLGPVVHGDLGLARSDRAGMRVLFVGNSLTYYNSMPGLVQQLAAADEGARPIFTVWYTAPGWTLREAAGDVELRALLEDIQWDTVVLQEQSQLAGSSLDQRRRETEPYAQDLQRRIAPGTRTVLFMTWRYREASDLAAELALPVSPVAPAWGEAEARRPEIDLRASDGRHPNRAGSYLAACVFYATLTGRNPSGSSFTAGLEESEARFLQQLAFETVTTPRRWS
jgi:hypothetical protein